MTPRRRSYRETVELDHVRRHASYIASTAPQLLIAMGVLARGLLSTLAMVYGPAVFLGVGAAWFYDLIPVVSLPTSPFPPAEEGATDLVIRPAAWWALGGVAAMAGLVWLAQLGKLGWGGTVSWQRARRTAILFTWKGVAVAAVVIGIPVVTLAAWKVSGLVNEPALAFGTTVGSVLTSYVVALVAMARHKKATVAKTVAALTKRPTRVGAVPQGLMQLIPVVAAVAVVVMSWLLIFGLSAMSTATARRLDQGSSLLEICGWVVGAVVVTLLALSDETSMSLHPFYRRRLARAFAVRSARLESKGEPCTVAVPYLPSERTDLSTHARPADPDTFPEFIFAASASLTGEERTPPGLSATSFVMGADWIGGPDVGWVQTRRLEQIATPRLRRDLTVQGAVAISGAAFATSMGRFSRWYQILFALTGARLGSWLPNPPSSTPWTGRAGTMGGSGTGPCRACPGRAGSPTCCASCSTSIPSRSGCFRSPMGGTTRTWASSSSSVAAAPRSTASTVPVTTRQLLRRWPRRSRWPSRSSA